MPPGWYMGIELKTSGAISCNVSLNSITEEGCRGYSARREAATPFPAGHPSRGRCAAGTGETSLSLKSQRAHRENAASQHGGEFHSSQGTTGSVTALGISM